MKGFGICAAIISFILLFHPYAPGITELEPVGSLHFASECEGLDVKGDLVYVATNWGLEVYEMRGRWRPMKIGEVPTPGLATDVAVRGNYAFVADRDRLTVIDVTDPKDMKPISVTPLKARTWKVAVKDGIVYLNNSNKFKSPASLLVIDASDPQKPKLISTLNDPEYVEDIAISGDHTLIAADEEDLVIIDISDPKTPKLLSKLKLPGRSKDVADQNPQSGT
jgi:hypothetical protein